MSHQNKLTLPLVIAVALGLFFFSDRISQTGWGCILLGLGLASFCGGFIYTRNAKRSRKWPKVEGIIKVSEVRESRSSSNSSGNRNKSYQFAVEYDYVVDDKPYTNNFYSYKITYNAAKSRGARELVKKYPVDSLVDVYYDPKKPERSVLLPGINRWSYLPFVAGLMFSFFGIGILTGYVS